MHQEYKDKKYMVLTLQKLTVLQYYAITGQGDMYSD